MTEEQMIGQVLKELGVDRTQPPHWNPNIETTMSGHKIIRGYLCSYCGIHSWTQKEICDGCNSIMRGENENE